MARAVLFDLYGTLVPAGTIDSRNEISREVGTILGVDAEPFAALVRSTFDARTRGQLGNLAETYLELAKRLGGFPSHHQVDLAIARRLEFARELLEPRQAEPVLQSLRTAGYRLGVVTDCSIETPTIWTSTWLYDYVEAVAFSCDVGLRKPDPRVYLAVTEAIGVSSEDCVFVGDGGSGELSGARSLGMEAIRVVESSETGIDRPDEELDWDGDSIRSLRELLERLSG
ncbi:MAG: HAD-IA family hydrolase [Gallionella sp.]|jgi:putative hydrolase of the HAD superfamily|nr:HAD-IA family hydrolase [Gallionella sp.]NNN08386.1 HAD-IA family hydrolase [Acidimicrobiaceae bacterium]